MGLFHGTGYLLARRRLRRSAGWLVAAVLSSFAFSAMHYLGPLGDPLHLSSFVFRLLLGVVLAGVYKARGFAIAAWTHTLYDVMPFTLRGALTAAATARCRSASGSRPPPRPSGCG